MADAFVTLVSVQPSEATTVSSKDAHEPYKQVSSGHYGQLRARTQVSAGGAPLVPTLILPGPRLSAASNDTGDIVVSLAPQSGYSSHNLYWSLTPGVTKSSNKITGVDRSYVHTGRTVGQRVYYAAATVMPAGEGPLSDEVSAVAEIPIAISHATPPVEMAWLNGLSTHFVIGWYRNERAASYRIYYSETPGAKAGVYVETTNPGYYDFTPASIQSGTYYFQVVAVGPYGEGTPSTEMSASATLPAPVITPTTTAAMPTTVTITTTVVGGAVYYTTNDTAPTAASTLYTGPFSVASYGTKIRAVVIKNGTSPEATPVSYTVDFLGDANTIAYWEMENTTGSKLTDSKGALTLNVSGTVAIVAATGRRAGTNCADFNNLGYGYLSSPAALQTPLYGNCTIEGWMYVPSGRSGTFPEWFIYFGTNNGTTGRRITAFYDWTNAYGGTHKLVWCTYDGADTQIVGASTAFDTWIHFAYRRKQISGNSWQHDVWQDGVQISSQACGPFTAGTASIYMGADYGVASFVGRLDQVRFSNKYRSDAELLSFFNNT